MKTDIGNQKTKPMQWSRFISSMIISVTTLISACGGGTDDFAKIGAKESSLTSTVADTEFQFSEEKKCIMEEDGSGYCPPPGGGGSTGGSGGSAQPPYTKITCIADDGCTNLGNLFEGAGNIYTVTIQKDHDVDLDGGMTMNFALDERSSGRYYMESIKFTNGVKWVDTNNKSSIKVPKDVYSFKVTLLAVQNNVQYDTKSNVRLMIDDGEFKFTLVDTTPSPFKDYVKKEVQQQQDDRKLVVDVESSFSVFPDSSVGCGKVSISTVKLSARNYNKNTWGWHSSSQRLWVQALASADNWGGERFIWGDNPGETNTESKEHTFKFRREYCGAPPLIKWEVRAWRDNTSQYDPLPVFNIGNNT